MSAKQSVGVSYLRVSGAGQIDGDGFPRQREAIERFAREKRVTIAEEFRDEAVSGTKPLAERPGLLALMDYLRAGTLSLVVVERMDRLARDLLEGELILREFRRHSIRVVSAESGVDLTAGESQDPTAKLIRHVLGAVAEFEKSALVAKLRVARDRKRSRGERCEGRRPFGTTDDERRILKRMAQLRRRNRNGERRTLDEVATVINSEGHRSQSGQTFTAGMVHNLLVRSQTHKQKRAASS